MPRTVHPHVCFEMAVEKCHIYLGDKQLVYNTRVVYNYTVVHETSPRNSKLCVSFRNSLGWLCVSVVKNVALITLSYFVDESQLDLLRLDAHMLQFFLDHIQAALRSRKFGHAGWMISEVIHGLSNLAKNDFNKHLIVSQGNHAAERSVNRCRSRVSFHFD